MRVRQSVDMVELQQPEEQPEPAGLVRRAETAALQERQVPADRQEQEEQQVQAEMQAQAEVTPEDSQRQQRLQSRNR